MAAWLLTAVSAVAIAQTKRNVPLRVINPSTQAVIRGALATTHFSVCQLSAVHLSGSNGILRDQRPANCFAASGTTQLLGPFVLDFGRGKDHKIKEIGLYTFGSQLQAVIADNDGNDNFSASARMIAATSGRSLTTQSPGLCQPRVCCPLSLLGPAKSSCCAAFASKEVTTATRTCAALRFRARATGAMSKPCTTKAPVPTSTCRCWSSMPTCQPRWSLRATRSR